MPELTETDFLDRIFALKPIFVAVLIWLVGWGSLFLIAWRTNSITTVLFRHPGFMIGDFLLLPLISFLITKFYQSANNAHERARSKRWNYFSIALATLFTVADTIFSVFISKHYQNIWSIPHTIFIWVFVYILVNFFSKGSYHLLHKPDRLLWTIYIVTSLAVIFHIILKFAFFGFARFPVI